MIQINLLPDLKQQFLKMRRYRQIMSIVTGVVGVVCFVMIGYLYVKTNVWQKNQKAKLEASVQTEVAKIGSDSDLNTILGIQHKLNSLQTLYDFKVPTMRAEDIVKLLLQDSYDQVNNYSFDFEEGTFQISGNSKSYEETQIIVNRFANALVCFGEVDSETNVAAFADDDCFPEEYEKNEINDLLDDGKIEWALEPTSFTGDSARTLDEVDPYNISGTFIPELFDQKYSVNYSDKLNKKSSIWIKVYKRCVSSSCNARVPIKKATKPTNKINQQIPSNNQTPTTNNGGTP